MTPRSPSGEQNPPGRLVIETPLSEFEPEESIVKAAVWKEPGQPLVIENVPDPSPGPEELLLRVHGAGICGSDLHTSDIPAYPSGTIMGHEFSGEIVAIGANAASLAMDERPFELGDRVCSLPGLGCGKCGSCYSGEVMACTSLRTAGIGDLSGAYAEFVRVGARESLRLPENVGYAEGALVEPLAVGLHSVQRARLKPTDRVLVIGAGPVGVAVALWARQSGVSRVIVSDMVATRRDLACQLAATHAIDPNREDVASAFERMAGRGPDVIFECVGVPGMLQHCVELAPRHGRVIVAGVCIQPDTFTPVIGVTKELSLEFVSFYERPDFAHTLDMLGTERLVASPMITNTVPLTDMPAAFEALKQPTTQCKVIVEP